MSSRPKGRYDEVIDLRSELQGARERLQVLENRLMVLGSTSMPVGSTIRCFPTLPRSFSPVSWVPWDGTTALLWWYAASDVPARARHLVLTPGMNVVEVEGSGAGGSGAGTYIRFTVHDASEEKKIIAASPSSPSPTTLLLFVGSAIPKAYRRTGPKVFEPI